MFLFKQNESCGTWQENAQPSCLCDFVAHLPKERENSIRIILVRSLNEYRGNQTFFPLVIHNRTCDLETGYGGHLFIHNFSKYLLSALLQFLPTCGNYTLVSFIQYGSHAYDTYLSNIRLYKVLLQLYRKGKGM